ncbi:Na+/H+ antiporter NhaA [Planomonospora sp. ID82291]|nr:Na+/H+ antiporter NhaA [Planomonospora sp. ID82291]
MPILAGIGFTVSLPTAGPAFGDDPERPDTATAGVLTAGLAASLPAAALPGVRVHRHPNAQDDDGIGAR